MSDPSTEFKEISRLAEYHAYSVRQLIAQRTRLFQLFEAIGGLARFNSGGDLANVLAQIETSPTQFYQDVYCQLLNGGKRNGFFVEFGACDGRLLSNTLSLEERFGWTGILSEPMPSWHGELQKNRKCIIDKRCVWIETGKTIEFAEFSGDEHRTESSAYVPNSAQSKSVSAIHEVETVSLYDLLQQNNAPKVIDFISMDVEGGEFPILNAFPFSEYKFNFMCVEQHGDNSKLISDLLRSNGYRQVYESASGHDGYYVPAEA